ncbi:exopolysaccharide production protein ExoQ [Kaistia soli DSM 19436]|uniref:Exopolysaccharide production protein ExoQ n=1 Tax=Kaistia soli DSM 19436 TaxID=1122133 RepID=A0A1M4Y3H6_9HYPH|nr:O-antigen ligase family protein [Kaistia soli]SHF00032.1 exopolysaccharide production protein ExoQ [Kaistia soli DSM 19436]
MRSLTYRGDGKLSVRWRTIEWWGAGICLLLQTGAFFPLLMAGPVGELSDAGKAKLRLVSLPVYAFTLLILSQNVRPFLIALARNVPLQLLTLLPLASVVWSVSPSTTLRRAIGLLFSILLAYVLAIRFTPRQLLLLLMIVIGVCIVASLGAVVALPSYARTPTDGTIRGVFLTKNTLGWYASVLALICGVIALDGSMGYRKTALALLVASLACLAGSTSMTAIIATTSAACVYVIYALLPKVRGVVRVVYVLVVIQTAVLILVVMHEYLVPLLTALGKDATLTGRVPLWELVDAEISRHLLLGFGFQAFWTEGNPLAWAIWNKVAWMPPHAHNGYRDILLSFGVGGFVLFCGVVMRAVHQGAVLQCREPQEGWLWLNVFLIMVLVMNLTESLFLNQNDCIATMFATAIIMFSVCAPVRADQIIRYSPVAEPDFAPPLSPATNESNP